MSVSLCLLALLPCCPQGSQQALSVGPGAGFLSVVVDDDVPGEGSRPTDLGTGDFTLELWLRGKLGDNPSPGAGGGVELAGPAWLTGEVLLDRSAVGTERGFGVSLAGGRARFWTGGGDAPGADAGHTLEGQAVLLDGGWHHLVVSRDTQLGEKRIWVDGALDAVSSPGVSFADLSYPDGGVAGGGPPENPELWLGAGKAAGVSAFVGDVDELRLWTRASSDEDVLSWFDRVAVPVLPDLAADYRLEAGSGTVVRDHHLPASEAATLVPGPAGPAWLSYFANAGSTAPISHGLLPFGFHRERELGGLAEATCLRRLPGGDFLIAERAGAVMRYDGSALTRLLQLDPALDTIEYGIVGLELDPGFASNGWFYLHYTAQGPEDRVSRFTLGSGPGGTVDPASEFVVWSHATVGPGHTGGAISFGPDGMLYIPTGDGFQPDSSQDLASLNGKVLRVDPAGGLPPDNPGASIPGAHPAVWAWGLRNPFRSHWDLDSGVYWIADVGADDAQAWEELHHGVAGANYGWPEQEGPECVGLDCSGMTVPVYGYRHDDTALAPAAPTGSITGGLIYRGPGFPSDFLGNYLFGDYANRWIRRLRLDASGQVIDAPIVVPYFTGGTMVAFETDAAGDLWVLTVGLPWGGGGSDDSALYRITYVPEDDPTPVSTVVLASEPSGLLIELDGYPVTTPFAFRTREGFTHTVEAPFSQLDGSTSVSFVCWSDDGGASHTITAPRGGLNLTASYSAVGAACDAACGFASAGHGSGGRGHPGPGGGRGLGGGRDRPGQGHRGGAGGGGVPRHLQGAIRTAARGWDPVDRPGPDGHQRAPGRRLRGGPVDPGRAGQPHGGGAPPSGSRPWPPIAVPPSAWPFPTACA